MAGLMLEVGDVSDAIRSRARPARGLAGFIFSFGTCLSSPWLYEYLSIDGQRALESENG